MEFKNVFRELRREKGYSQVDMAKALNVSKSTIGMWETGDRLPYQDKMEDIADYFNVDMDYLYGKTDVKRRVLFDSNGDKYVPEYSPDIMELIFLYSKATDQQKQSILAMLKTFVN